MGWVGWVVQLTTLSLPTRVEVELGCDNNFKFEVICRSIRNVFNPLLATLCIVYLLVIMTNLVFSVNTLHPNHPSISLLVPWSDGLCHITVSMSVFLTIAIWQLGYGGENT